jgi:hypothetical protein
VCVGRARLRRDRGDEREQVGVDAIGERDRHTVRCARVHCELRARYELGAQQPGVADRDDLVVVAVQHERRPVDLLEVVREIGFRERFDALVEADEAALQPKRIEDTFGNRRTGPVPAEERDRRIVQNCDLSAAKPARNPLNTSIGVPALRYRRRRGAEPPQLAPPFRCSHAAIPAPSRKACTTWHSRQQARQLPHGGATTPSHAVAGQTDIVRLEQTSALDEESTERRTALLTGQGVFVHRRSLQAELRDHPAEVPLAGGSGTSIRLNASGLHTQFGRSLVRLRCCERFQLKGSRSEQQAAQPKPHRAPRRRP